jgi:hypothetical protein
MNLRNKAVEAAYEAGKYTDEDGTEWRRGMDGWFLDNVDGKGGKMLCYHHDMVEKIEREHPE